MAAALGAMVTRLAKLDSGVFEDDRRFFTCAAERDAAEVSLEVVERACAAYAGGIGAPRDTTVVKGSAL